MGDSILLWRMRYSHSLSVNAREMAVESSSSKPLSSDQNVRLVIIEDSELGRVVALMDEWIAAVRILRQVEYIWPLLLLLSSERSADCAILYYSPSVNDAVHS